MVVKIKFFHLGVCFWSLFDHLEIVEEEKESRMEVGQVWLPLRGTEKKL